MSSRTSSPYALQSAVIVLDLPKNSILGLDGTTATLQDREDDFLGFSPFPTKPWFHLLSVQPPVENPDNLSSSEAPSQKPSLTTGVVVLVDSPPVWMVRRFDPTTEELSSSDDDVPVDTRNKIKSQLQSLQLQHRLLPYNQFVKPSQRQPSSWDALTCHVTSSLLQKRNIRHGDKLLPGNTHENTNADGTMPQISSQDGHQVLYPPIPLLARRTRATRHAGTRQFLQQLSAKKRTHWMFHQSSQQQWQYILQHYYDQELLQLLGDLQLSFVCFRQLHCYSSWIHWRDLICCCCDSAGDSSTIQPILAVLLVQFRVMEVDHEYYDDDLMTSTATLHWMDVLKEWIQTLFDSSNEETRKEARELGDLLQDRFPLSFQQQQSSMNQPYVDDDSDDNEDSNGHDKHDEDAPLVVSEVDVQAAWERNQQKVPKHDSSVRSPRIEYSAQVREEFPILFAAMQPHEDVMMTCARALDEAHDVSLVRQAAAYLETTVLLQQDANDQLDGMQY